MSNIAVLTQSHVAIAAKKSAKRNQIKEIVFDDEARREFLTGFHKRKLAKADAARKKAALREKEARQEARREQRQMLRERAVENAAEVEAAYGATLDADGDDHDEWSGISDSRAREKGKQKEEEYEDEEVLATVAVVEDFDPDSFIHGPKIKTTPSEATVTHPPPAKPTSKWPKKVRPKKIRYETKDARTADKSRQRARRTEKAELAGGKASRKKGNNGKKRR